MSFVQRFSASVTTATTGAGSAQTADVTGRIVSVRLVTSTATGVGFATAGTLTVSTADTGITVLSRSAGPTFTAHPRIAISTTTGGAVTYGTAAGDVTDFVYVANEKLTVSVASGGPETTGTVTVVVA
jgi:hypothetical protein